MKAFDNLWSRLVAWCIPWGALVILVFTAIGVGHGGKERQEAVVRPLALLIVKYAPEPGRPTDCPARHALDSTPDCGQLGAAPAPAPLPAVIAVPGDGTIYSYDQLRMALIARGLANEAAAGLPGPARVGAAIAMAESAGRARAVDNTMYPALPGYHLPGPGAQPEYSVGPWQINLPVHPGVSAACAMELTCGAGAAAGISNHGTNWTPWSTYTSGAYLAFLH